MTAEETETLVLLYNDGDVESAVVVVGEDKTQGMTAYYAVITARLWAQATGLTVNWASPVRGAETIDHPDLDRIPIEKNAL